jgi:hypothetical protein
MARPKGLPKTGGRKKGTPNKTTAERREKAKAKSLFGDDFQSALNELATARLTPLEVMHAVMFIRIGKADYAGAMEAAEKAAPYCHARLNAAEVKVSHSLSDRTSEQLAADIEMIRTKLAIAKQPGGLLSGPLNPVIDLPLEHVAPGGETGDGI